MGVHGCAWVRMGVRGSMCCQRPLSPRRPMGCVWETPAPPEQLGCSPRPCTLAAMPPRSGHGDPAPCPLRGGDEHGGHAPGDSQASLGGAREQEAARCPQKYGCQDLARWEGWRLFWVRRSIAPSPTFTPSALTLCCPPKVLTSQERGKDIPNLRLWGIFEGARGMMLIPGAALPSIPDGACPGEPPGLSHVPVPAGLCPTWDVL